MPDAIIGLLAFVGVLLYASVAIAIAKTGERNHYYSSDWLFLRVSTTATVFAIWGFLFWWAVDTTFNGGKHGEIGNFLLLDLFGAFAVLGLMILIWAPGSYQQKKAFASIWPLALIANVLGKVCVLLSVGVAKAPNAIGTYIANYVNESRNPEVKDAA